MRSPRRLAALTACLALAGTAACSTDSSRAADGRLDVVAAFYPLQYVAEKVGGDRVHVTNLVQPGAEPHDLELSPKQVTQVAKADLVVYLAGFQPEIDTTVKQEAKEKGYDVAAVQPLRDAPPGAEKHGDEHGKEEKEHANEGKDPHVWLDPTRLATIADKLADRLAQADAGNAAGYRDRAAALRRELEALDKEFAAGLATCARRDIVTSHAAFGYLADRYRLTQLPISGLSPEEEPTPARLAEVAKVAKGKQVTTVFFETLVSPKVAETLAREIGAKAEVLDPIEGIADGGGDYVSVMRTNLAKLKPALGCS
jgi:zinc transport system substrate-binding protein